MPSNSQWIQSYYCDELRRWVATSITSGATAYSADGITWTAGSAIAGAPLQLAWSPEFRLFTMPRNATTTSYESNNGITWTANNTMASAPWNACCWAGKLHCFLAVASNGVNARGLKPTTPGGVVRWVAGNTFTGGATEGMCWSEPLGLAVAVGTLGNPNGVGQIAVSRDGINYKILTGTPIGSWRWVEWSNSLNMFVAVAVGPQGAIYSRDGYKWANIPGSAPMDSGSVIVSEERKEICVTTEATGVFSYLI
jgi:hypothetical protein